MKQKGTDTFAMVAIFVSPPNFMLKLNSKCNPIVLRGGAFRK
jgi:hypothetical protein